MSRITRRGAQTLNAPVSCCNPYRYKDVFEIQASKKEIGAMKYIKPKIVSSGEATRAIRGTSVKGPSLTFEMCSHPNLITLPAYEADE